jgi:hypothetical protein
MFKKFKEIATAWVAAADPTPEQKIIAEYRASVCNTCEYRKQNTALVDFYYCKLCGCPLNKKIFAPDKTSCPKNKWIK